MSNGQPQAPVPQRVTYIARPMASMPGMPFSTSMPPPGYPNASQVASRLPQPGSDGMIRFQIAQMPKGTDPQQDSLKFDGRRLRKAVYRKTVDYNSDMVKYLENRIWQREGRDEHWIQPDTLYSTDMVPPIASSGNTINCVTTKFVRQSTNKIRCPIFAIAFTPEGRRLVTGASSGEFTLWNGLTFNFETILQAHDAAIRCMRWNNLESWMVTGDQNGYVKYWQSNMNNVKTYLAHKEPVRDVSFSPTDAKFVSCSDDATVKIWDFLKCYEERSLRGHGADVKCVDWHPQKALILSGSKDAQQPIKIWDPKTGRALATLHPHKNTVMDLRWNKNGNWLATASRDHLVKIFDIRNMKEAMQTFRGHKKEATVLAWHPIHESLLASGGSDGAIMFWEVGTEKELGAIEEGHESIIWTMDWHPLGHILATGSNDHSTKFWTRNPPGDSMADRYNISAEAAAKKEFGDEVSDKLSDGAVIPGMGLDTKDLPPPTSDMPPRSYRPEPQRKRFHQKPVNRDFELAWESGAVPMPRAPRPAAPGSRVGFEPRASDRPRHDTSTRFEVPRHQAPVRFEGPRHLGPRQVGPRHAGPRHDGPRHEGPRHAGPQHDGPRHEGPRHAGPQHDGPRHEGQRQVGPRHDGPLLKEPKLDTQRADPNSHIPGLGGPSEDPTRPRSPGGDGNSWNISHVPNPDPPAPSAPRKTLLPGGPAQLGGSVSNDHPPHPVPHKQPLHPAPHQPHQQANHETQGPKRPSLLQDPHQFDPAPHGTEMSHDQSLDSAHQRLHNRPHSQEQFDEYYAIADEGSSREQYPTGDDSHEHQRFSEQQHGYQKRDDQYRNSDRRPDRTDSQRYKQLPHRQFGREEHSQGDRKYDSSYGNNADFNSEEYYEQYSEQYSHKQQEQYDQEQYQEEQYQGDQYQEEQYQQEQYQQEQYIQEPPYDEQTFPNDQFYKENSRGRGATRGSRKRGWEDGYDSREDFTRGGWRGRGEDRGRGRGRGRGESRGRGEGRGRGGPRGRGSSRGRGEVGSRGEDRRRGRGEDRWRGRGDSRSGYRGGYTGS